MWIHADPDSQLWLGLISNVVCIYTVDFLLISIFKWHSM
jgi:hypothetical protein